MLKVFSILTISEFLSEIKCFQWRYSGKPWLKNNLFCHLYFFIQPLNIFRHCGNAVLPAVHHHNQQASKYFTFSYIHHCGKSYHHQNKFIDSRRIIIHNPSFLNRVGSSVWSQFNLGRPKWTVHTHDSLAHEKYISICTVFICWSPYFRIDVSMI